MKKILCLLTTLLFTVTLWSVDISSPDKKLNVTVKTEDGKLFYSLKVGETQLISDSNLGITTQDSDFFTNLTIKDSKKSSGTQKYTMPFGKKLAIDTAYEEVEITAVNDNGKELKVFFRIFNDGAAFCYELQGTGSTTVTKEHSSFQFDSNTTCWLQPYTINPGWEPSYEKPYRKVSAGLKVSETAESFGTNYGKDSYGWCFPALFSRNGYYCLISETGVDKNYCGSHLSDNCSNYNYAIQFPHPGENHGTGQAEPVMPLPGKTPWRVIIAGDLNTIAESTLIFDNAQPLDSKFNDTIPEWIQPGTSAWDWWFYGTGGFARQKRYIDAAAEFGWDYILIDAGWNFWVLPYTKVKKLVKYGESKGVKILLWYNSGGPHNKRAVYPRNFMHNKNKRRREMKKLQKLGVAGLKVDFFQSDKQERIQQYIDILDDAADFNLMINFHGCTIPRGWERRFPNLMTMEGIMGAEAYGGTKFYGATALDCVVYTFTRNVIGSMDFTPVTFHEKKYILDKPDTMTFSFTLATAIAFESGWQHFPDCADNDKYGYRKVFKATPEAKELLNKLPAIWDESRLLSGSPETHALWARRSGETWFVAGLNGTPGEFTFTTDLSFLGNGNYKATIIKEGESPITLSTESKTVTAADSLEIRVSTGCGISLMFEKK